MAYRQPSDCHDNRQPKMARMAPEKRLHDHFWLSVVAAVAVVENPRFAVGISTLSVTVPKIYFRFWRSYSYCPLSAVGAVTFFRALNGCGHQISVAISMLHFTVQRCISGFGGHFRLSVNIGIG